MFLDILGVLIAGLIIGVLARLLVPGRQAMPWWLTLVTGVVAVLIGRLIAQAFGVAQTAGIDWIKWGITIVVGVVLTVIVAAIYPRLRKPTGTATQ